jgi:DTW domain-containing protein YfiP
MSIQRQRKTRDPCPSCYLHRERCICHLLTPQLDLATRVTLVVHAKELKRTTNTGRLAMQVLKNSETCVRGLNQAPLNLSHLVRPDYDSFLLSPTTTAIELSEIDIQNRTKPIHLIVPDGNWRQASKVAVRHAELRTLPRVKLTRLPGEIPQTTIRKEHFADGMATLEAIAYALAHFEGAEVATRLLALYTAKLAATLEGRQPHL